MMPFLGNCIMSPVSYIPFPPLETGVRERLSCQVVEMRNAVSRAEKVTRRYYYEKEKTEVKRNFY